MRKRYAFILVSCLMMAVPVIAITKAGNHIVFNQLKYDFGKLCEDDEASVCVFLFTNHSSKPIAIARVQTTCGCAVAHYTQEAVLPGKAGKISITYNPQGRPGRFNRSAFVRFSGSEQTFQLSIYGEVIPGVERKQKAYPYVMGDLQLKTDRIRFNAMRGNEQEQSIVVVNSGKQPLQLQFTTRDSYVSASLTPPILPPNETGEVRIIRKADQNKTQAKCIRIKANKITKKEAGLLSLELINEICE